MNVYNLNNYYKTSESSSNYFLLRDFVLRLYWISSLASHISKITMQMIIPPPKILWVPDMLLLFFLKFLMILWEFSRTYFGDIHHLPLLQISPKFNSSSLPYPSSLYVKKKNKPLPLSADVIVLWTLGSFLSPLLQCSLSLGYRCCAADVSHGAGYLIFSCQHFDQLWLPVTVSVYCKEMPLWLEDKCTLILPHFFEVLFTQTGSGKFKLTFFYLLPTAWWWSMFPQEISKLVQKHDTINSTITL